MSLTEKTRSPLFRGLRTVVDDEEAVAEMLTNLDSRNLDDLATKDFVRAEVSGLRADMHAEVRRIIVWTGVGQPRHHRRAPGCDPPRLTATRSPQLGALVDGSVTVVAGP